VESKAKLAQAEQAKADAESAAAKEAKEQAMKKIVKAHEQAVVAAKLAQAALERCKVAEERKGKAQLKMKPTVWEKLEKAAENPER